MASSAIKTLPTCVAAMAWISPSIHCIPSYRLSDTGPRTQVSPRFASGRVLHLASRESGSYCRLWWWWLGPRPIHARRPLAAVQRHKSQKNKSHELGRPLLAIVSAIVAYAVVLSPLAGLVQSQLSSPVSGEKMTCSLLANLLIHIQPL
jgi:hypothetical protein